MRIINFKLLVLIFLILSLSFSRNAGVNASEKKVDRLSDRIIVINDGYYRVIAINTNEGIVVIDAHVSIEDMEACMKLIAKEFNSDNFRYVIYSHGDLEHVLGHQALDNAEHIAHLGLRIRKERNAKYITYIDSMLSIKKTECVSLDSTAEKYTEVRNEINKLKWQKQANHTAMQLKPDIEFSDRMLLAFDSLTVELIYYGMGHGYSLFVSVPEEKFLFSSTASSAILIPFWFLEYNTDFVDVSRSIDVLSEFVLQTDTLKHIIPCHGPYLTNKQLWETYEYHRVLYESVESAIEKNIPQDELKEELALDTKYASFSFSQDLNEELIKKHYNNIELIWDYIKNDTEN